MRADRFARVDASLRRLPIFGQIWPETAMAPFMHKKAVQRHIGGAKFQRELGLKRIILLAGLCAVALAPAAAYADPLGILYAGTGNGQTITVKYNNNFESTFAG